MRVVCVRVVCCITAFRCRDPTSQMRKLQNCTDFLPGFRLVNWDPVKYQDYYFIRLGISDAAMRVIKATRNLAEIGRVSEDDE